jgi:tetratricopeptide (TPR) repeat protein
MELLRSGKTQAALAEFQAASRLDPRSVQAFVLVGVAENQLGKGQEAVSALRHALELDPNSEAAHYNLALSLAQLNRPDEAIHELRAVLKLNPRLTTANYNLGVLLEKQGDYEGAIQALQAARDSQPGDSATLVHLVTDCMKAGKNTQAVSLAQDAASRDAKGDLSIQLGLLLMEHTHFKEAVQLLETARSRVPASGELNLTLARAYIGAGQPQKAIGLLRTSQSEDSSWQVWYLAGLAYMSLNDAVSSIASFREAVRLAPNQPKVHFQLGRLLLASTSESEQNEGIQELTQAISLEPRETENYAVLGKWLLEHEYVKDAISVLEPGIRNSPPSAVLEVMMALAQATLRGGAAARPFAEKALQLDPRMALALYMVGFSYLNAGDYAEAANYYKQATEIDPRNDVYFFNLAVALWRLNRPADALSYAQRSAALSPGRGLNHYLLGKIYMKLNRDDQARTELETSIRLNPKLENSYYLLSQIYARMGNASEAQAMQEKLAQLRQIRDKAVQFESPESDPAELLPPSRVLQGHERP